MYLRANCRKAKCTANQNQVVHVLLRENVSRALERHNKNLEIFNINWMAHHRAATLRILDSFRRVYRVPLWARSHQTPGLWLSADQQTVGGLNFSTNSASLNSSHLPAAPAFALDHGKRSLSQTSESLGWQPLFIL
jgi:hypothetical protein